MIYSLWALWLGKPFHIAGPRLFSSILGRVGEKGGRCKSVAIGLSLDLPCLKVFNYFIFSKLEYITLFKNFELNLNKIVLEY